MSVPSPPDALPMQGPSTVRGDPRWSVAELLRFVPLSRAGLAGNRARVKVGPPLSCNGPSMVQVPHNSSLSYGPGGQGYWVFRAPDPPMSSLGNGLAPLTNTVGQPCASSVLRRPDESMVDAVRADVIPDNDVVVVNRSHFRCQGAGQVNTG